MENQQREQLARLLAGAAMGAAFAFLFTTRNGKRFLDSADLWLDDVTGEMQRLRGTAAKVRDAVNEGRRSFESIANLGWMKETQGADGKTGQTWPPEARH